MKKLLFNNKDRQLLMVLNNLSEESGNKKSQKFFNYHMHPRGIKELVEPKVVRVATLLYRLLDTLEEGKEDERLNALHSIRDEVFFSVKGGMTRNTARIQLSIMKDLIRETDELKRLELAHDFYSIMTGKPVIVRSFLKKYHLLEMPEEWNQITFDQHVHDVYTKGRKSPTHLIMDAWIKGIREIKVIYYGFIPVEAARELLIAANYLDIKVRIGVDFPTVYRGKTVSLIWTPRGFKGTDHFLKFLGKKKICRFMDRGREVVQFTENIVLEKFSIFNQTKRELLNEEYGLSLPVLKVDELKEFVGAGQLSLLHVSEFINQKVVQAADSKLETLREVFRQGNQKEQDEITAYINGLNGLTSELIFEKYLKEITVEIPEDETIPKLLTYPPEKLIQILDELHTSFRITLNLTGIELQDVIELVFKSNGRINFLEIFNYKDYAKGLCQNIPEIKDFQHALNDGNTIKLKKIIFSVIQRLEEGDSPDKKELIQVMYDVLENLYRLISMYADKPLKDKIGSDSTGRSNQFFGMGYAVRETLPRGAQKAIDQENRRHPTIMPLHLGTEIHRVFAPLSNGGEYAGRLRRLVAAVIPGLGFRKVKSVWEAEECSSNRKTDYNIVALGARAKPEGNGLLLSDTEPVKTNSLKYCWHFLNSDLKNGLKILIGFIPAFLTFYLTKDWWVLAYLGAPIWFGVTGLRNILQSVFGGDSLKRSPLLNWKDYVSWSRISDSLLYTGFSVPLLDYLVKHLILDNGFQINTSTNPVALYAFMGLVNGIYISSHNLVRGLPTAAICGNFFRSILSIPIAILFNGILAQILHAAGVPGVELMLQKWAAVISKVASDSVAGVIEGTADRNSYVRVRFQDYRHKIHQINRTYEKVDLLLSDVDVLHSLKKPGSIIKTIKVEDPELLKRMIYDALDFLYFWMYQPHARTVLKKMMKAMTREERVVFVRFQYVLRRQKQITEMFADGLVGKNFSKALSFYLSRADSYLRSLEKLI